MSTASPIPIAARRAMTPARRFRIWVLHDGICGLCAAPVALRACEVEHRVPIAMGGADEDGNLEVVHPRCHKLKTAADMKALAKARRLSGETGATRHKRPIASRGLETPKVKRTWPSRPFRRKP